MHGVNTMAKTGTQNKHKDYILDESKINRAQKHLGTITENETIEREPEEVLTKREQNKRAWQERERFIKTGRKEQVVIRIVYDV